jgi:uncharacterized metal-binding protein YceD (DUF177 family)
VTEEADLNNSAEEEILLALPACPVHETDCKSDEQLAALSSQQEDLAPAITGKSEGEKENPFQILEQLKN